MNLNPIILSIPIYFLLIGVELLVERFHQTKHYRFHDALTNISCGLTQQVTGVFMKVLGVGAYALLYQHLAIWHVPRTLLTGALLFVLADLCYYWAHRMSHEINLFWGGHVVHHQSEDYNLSVALRQGSWQELFTFAFYLPLAVIGFEPEFFVYVSAFVTLYQFWIHTEYIGRLGPLEWVLNTPSHHRVHHGRNPQYIDKNYAGALIIWDRLFGTFEPEQERPVYGVTVPVSSWNPVWANLGHYQGLWQQLSRTPGLGDKLRTLFGRPGWRPASQGGPYEIPAVDPLTYQKYHTPAPVQLNWYVFGQYVVTIGIGALFLFTQKDMNAPLRLITALWIGWAVVACGGLFENRRWATQLEPVRLLATLGLVLAFTYHTAWLGLAAGVGGAWLVAAEIWYARVRAATTATYAPVPLQNA
ncbi:sterol desaturase family protein [Hymenobacter lutimineralis]|uniref:Sterol desaturase family protein n=1 Tax=Hymenobacter lutimineralis TaxID=2606448 RepID=A0A5D6V9K4_9BACT|nr:sterol desaturase family protein [Hymenobacter lutimineralis]TYZ12563.1 sterol desaturase family protein [Hymenobacter lutimineralis]